MRPAPRIDNPNERWTVCDKETGFIYEAETLGWYKKGTSKEEVLQHLKNNGIKLKKGEDICIVETY